MFLLVDCVADNNAGPNAEFRCDLSFDLHTTFAVRTMRKVVVVQLRRCNNVLQSLCLPRVLWQCPLRVMCGMLPESDRSHSTAFVFRGFKTGKAVDRCYFLVVSKKVAVPACSAVSFPPSMATRLHDAGTAREVLRRRVASVSLSTRCDSRESYVNGA